MKHIKKQTIKKNNEKMAQIEDVLRLPEPLENPHFEALMCILTASYQQLRRQQDFFAPYGITPPQYNTLRILRGQYPKVCNLNVVKERIVDKNSDVSRLIERLRIGGFVTRVPNEKDRRAVDILITEKGINLLKELDDKVDSVWHLDTLSDEEAAQISALLEKILV